jgi:hypothetical protein
VNDRTDGAPRPNGNLYDLLMDSVSPHYSEFRMVSQTMLDGYSRFVSLGLPAPTVARAMLGGTLNLYCLFGMEAELPELLRGLADRIEGDVQIN